MVARRSFIFAAQVLATAALLVGGAAAQANPGNPAAAPAASSASQQPAHRVDYSRPKSHLFNFLAPYEPRQVPVPNFANTPRLDQLLKDGKLYLSLDDAIMLALENNLDLAIARYNLSIADTDVLRTKAGASARGVNTGIVSGTPGGSGTGATGASGGGAGGTSTGAGGTGTGSGGIVTSTLGGGPPTPSFDPFLSGSLQIEHATSQTTNKILTGTYFSQNNSGVANFSYNQGFATGTTLSVGFNNNRQATNSLFSVYNPVLSSNIRMTITQPLLQGFGIALNRRNIVIAKNNREEADISFRQQVISTVSQIQKIYWDLVSAYEDLQVKQRSLALAQQLLSDTQKQVQIGTMAPIEIVSAQSQVATTQQDMIVSQTNLQLQQLYMKNAISKNLNDQTLASADVIPTDTMSMPAIEPVQPVQDLINDALEHRPELATSRIDLVNRDINKKAYKNALLPTVNAYAYTGTSNIGGLINPHLGSSAPAGITSAGYPDVFSGLFGGDYPDYGIGINVQIPIRNRAAQADQVRSELEYSQAQVRLQQLQNQIRIQVRNAAFAVQQNRARVQAAQSAAKLANETLDAEQKKYLLGASTNYNVMQAQRDLAQAESNLVAARTAYEESRVDLDTATGMTLNTLGILIPDAETGNVTQQPHVPGIVPRSQAPANNPNAPATNPAQPPVPHPQALKFPAPGQAIQQPTYSQPPAELR